MRRTRLTILLILLVVTGLRCRAPLSSDATAQSYVRLLDTDPAQSLACMRQATDGNVLFLYTAEAPGDSVTSIELTKADPNGNVLWTKHFGGAVNYSAGDCLSLADGGIAVAGTHSAGKNSQVAFYLLDAGGNQLFEHDFYQAPLLSVVSIDQLNTGDFVIGSVAQDPLNANHVNRELDFLRLSQNGSYLANDSLPTWIISTSNPTQYQIAATSDLSGGRALAVGIYNSVSGPNATPAFYQWLSPDSIALAGILPKSGVLLSVVRIGPSSYVAAGDSSNYSPNSTPWIGELDPPFNGSTTIATTPRWSRAISVGPYGSITNIVQTKDGGFAATGYAASAVGDTSTLIFRFDSRGNDVWPYRTYSFNAGEVPKTILELPSGDLIVGGTTTSFGNHALGAIQIFLIHLKADGTPAS